MTDNSGTFAQNKSNRISALSALYQAEQSTLNTLDSQTLVLVGLLVTYGIAVVATLGTNGSPAGWMFVALPVPAWILLAYNAILWSKVASHTTAANAYRDALIAFTRDNRAPVGEAIPPRAKWLLWATWVFGLTGSRLLSYGVAFLLIAALTVYMLYRGYGSPWFWPAAVLYGLWLLILGAAWVRIGREQIVANM